MDLESVDTPALLVDLDKVERNCERMRRKCSRLGIQLRAHMKTHKTQELGQMMTGEEKRKIVVSTLMEAEHFAAWGFEDILYGFPIIEHNMKRCHKLATRLNEFHLLLDNPDFLPVFEKNPPPESKKWSVFISVNTGEEREGILWNDDALLINLAQKLSSSVHTVFMGLYTHCGHSYAATEVKEVQNIATLACQRVQHVEKILIESGIQCPVVSTGSTPSCSQEVEGFRSLTEIHVGNYLFYDAQQLSLGSCTLDDIAVKVATRIVGVYPVSNHFLIDCGFLGLSHDHGDSLATDGYALFQDHPELKLFGMCQELGKVTSRDGKQLDWSKLPIGSVLYLFPWHSCATAAMHSHYHCYRRGVENEEEMVGTAVKPCKHW